MWQERLVSHAVRFYLDHTPIARGTTFLRRKAAPWLVARLETGPWIRVSGVSDFEWAAFDGELGRERRTVERFVGRIGAGDTVVDVGANIGYYTLTAAARVGPSGRVVAIEANPHAARRLRENLALNRFGNVSVVEAAAARAPGTTRFHIAGDSEASSLFAVGGDEIATVEVRATTIDAELAAAGVRRVAVLKMDVEGAEIDALAGAERLLRGPQPPDILVEANPVMLRAAGASLAELRAFLEGHGYGIEVVERMPWRGEETENWHARPRR